MTFYRRQRSRRPPRGLDTLTNSTITAEGNAVLCFPPDGTYFRGHLTTKLDPSINDDTPYALYGRETPTPGVYKVTVADLETGSQYHLNSVLLRGKLRKTKEIIPTVKSDSIDIPISSHSNKIIHQYDDLFCINESCPSNFPHHEFLQRETNIVEDETILDPCQTFDESVESSISDLRENSPVNSIPLSDTTSFTDSPATPIDLKDPQTPQFSLDCEDEQNILQFTAECVYRGQKADMMIQQYMAGSKLAGSKCVVLTGPLRFSVNEMPLMTVGNMAWSM